MESKTAIRNIQNSVNAMVAVPGSTKLEAMATRKRIKSLQELQSRLHECFQIDTSFFRYKTCLFTVQSIISLIGCEVCRHQYENIL